MEKITARLFALSFGLILFLALPLPAQDLPETDYTFYLRFEDDESNDVPSLPDYWGRPFEAVDAVQRYEDSVFRFELVPLGGRNGRADTDTPNALLDVFSSLHRQNPNYRKGGSGENGKNGSSQDWHSRLNSDFFFHNKDHWYSGLWSVFSDMFSNELTLKIDTDGYLAIDQFRLEIARPLTFFNTFWSFSDETCRTVNDAVGVLWTHNDIRYTFCGYGGFDFFGMTPLVGTFFSVRFYGFDTGGYIGYRDGQFHIGSKFGYGHQFVSIISDTDFKTDFTSRFRLQPDLLVQFSFSPVTFSLFKQSDTFYSETFLQMAAFVNDFRYTKDTTGIAGFYLFGDFGRITTECVAAFYSLNEDFLSLDESLTFLVPYYFSECIVQSRFSRWKLHFAGYLDGDFSPNISFGTGVGVADIDVKPIRMGFFADFVVENNLSDYRITVRTEIATDISRYFAFYIKSYNNFYCNKPEFDFYIQAGFRSFF